MFLVEEGGIVIPAPCSTQARSSLKGIELYLSERIKTEGVGVGLSLGPSCKIEAVASMSIQ